MHSKDLFEILAREHADALLIFLRSLIRDRAAVDDLFQETLLTAWKTLDRFDRSRPFGPWLRGIAGKLALAHRRKSARGMLLCDAEILERLDRRTESVQRQSGDTLDDKLAALKGCLDALPEPYRTAVERRYRDDGTVEDLATRLGVSMESLKKRLQRGRSRLLDCLERKLPAVEAPS